MLLSYVLHTIKRGVSCQETCLSVYFIAYMEREKTVAYPVRLFVRDIRHRLLLGGALTILIASCLNIFFRIPGGVQFYFLHTTVLFGIDNIGEYRELFYSSLFGFIVLAVNSFAGWYMSRFRPWYGIIFSVAAFLMAIAVAFQAFIVVFLNT